MYFEEFKIGDRFSTRTRLITGTDVDIFTMLTGAINPVFLDDEHGRKIGYKGRIVPGVMTLSLAMGLQYAVGLLDHMRAFLGINELRFLASVNPGDIIKCQVEVIGKKEVKRDGVVTFKWICENQDEKPVLEAEAAFIVLKKPMEA